MRLHSVLLCGRISFALPRANLARSAGAAPCGIEIFDLVGPDLGPKEPGPDIVSQYLFKGKAVTLEHGKEEKREHEANHQEKGRAVSDGSTAEQVGRNPCRRCE